MERNLLIPLVFIQLFFSCYYPISYNYTVDLKSETVTVEYHDLRSDEDSDSSISRDWQDLRKSLDYHDSVYESSYFKVLSKKIYQKDTALSGMFTYQIRTTDTSYSFIEFLKSITGSDEEDYLSWHATNREIFLFVDKDADYILNRSNGKQMETKEANIAIWSRTDSLLTFTFSVDSCCPGATLLPYFLADKSVKKKTWFNR